MTEDQMRQRIEELKAKREKEPDWHKGYLMYCNIVVLEFKLKGIKKR